MRDALLEGGVEATRIRLIPIGVELPLFPRVTPALRAAALEREAAACQALAAQVQAAREHIDREGVVWSTLGRLPGVVLGGFAVSRLEPEALATWIGGFVIVFGAALQSAADAGPALVTMW
mgnify:CR=1 FL=1